MLQKHLSLTDCEIKLVKDAGTFTGYASRFGTVDTYGDTIERGAYAETLEAHGMPKMFVQHDSRALPVGKWLSAKEDDYGLLVEGEFTPGMVRAAEARAALQHGTVDGLSIGYLLKKTDYEEQDRGRLIHKVSNLLEISIVTWPAEQSARVDLTSVKSSDIEQLETIRDFSRFLRDAGGFSKGLTDALISRAKVLFTQGDPAEDRMDAKAEQELKDALLKMQDRMGRLIRP